MRLEFLFERIGHLWLDLRCQSFVYNGELVVYDGPLPSTPAIRSGYHADPKSVVTVYDPSDPKLPGDGKFKDDDSIAGLRQNFIRN